MLSLPNGAPLRRYAFRRVFERINPSELEYCLSAYGKSVLEDLSEKQIVIDGKKQWVHPPTSRGKQRPVYPQAWVSEKPFLHAQGEGTERNPTK